MTDSHNPTVPLRGQDLARAVVAVVEAHPELHDQHVVTCGTAACLAGWTVALHLGARPGRDLDGYFCSEQWEALQQETDFAAADLLGVDHRDFVGAVFINLNREQAIDNFKRLTGVAP